MGCVKKKVYDLRPNVKRNRFEFDCSRFTPFANLKNSEAIDKDGGEAEHHADL